MISKLPSIFSPKSKITFWYNQIIPEIERYTKERDFIVHNTEYVFNLYYSLNEESLEQGPVLEELKTLAYLIRDNRIGNYLDNITNQHDQLVAVLNLRRIYGCYGRAKS